MKLSFLLTIALFSSGICQDDAVLERRSMHRVRSKGPKVDISLKWRRFPCAYPSRLYEVSLCSPDKLCVQDQVTTEEHEFKYSDDFPVVFWTSYTLEIQAFCEDTGFHLWSVRKINTGPGELVPPRGVASEGGDQNATITWRNLPKQILDVVDYVEIVVCHEASKVCMEAIKASPDSEEYTIERLSKGVEYTANISLCKEFDGKLFRSQAVSTEFITNAPKVEEFPPIKDLVVHVVRNDRDVDLELTYTKPEGPTEAEFVGVQINVLDRTDFAIVKDLQSTETNIRIQNLPFFAHFTVKIRALYEDADHLAESMEVSEAIATGNGILPAKPRIVEMMSISKDSVFIRWSKTAHRSVDFSYKIILTDNSTVDIDKPNVEHALVKGDLEPDLVYNVTFVTLLSYDNITKILSVDEGEKVRMLPEDALVPNFTVDDILGDYIYLRWYVRLPESSRQCHISVALCGMATECSMTIVPDATDTSASFKIEPFALYNVTMNTTCVFAPDVTTFGVSETRSILAAARPPAVIELNGDAPDEASLNVFWAAGPFYTMGYKVRYTVASEESWNEYNTSVPSYIIVGLESSTEYNVSVLPYSMDGDKILLGPPKTITLSTREAVPPKVIELTAEQVPFSMAIKVHWKAPSFGQVHLGFRIMTICPGSQNFWTNDTRFEFRAQDRPSMHRVCSIAVQSYNRESHLPRLSPRSHFSFDLQSLPPPAGAEAVFVSDGKYLIKVTPPGVVGLKDFEYQASADLKFAERHKSNEFLVEEDRFNTNVTYALRVCVNDLCGRIYILIFETNTGPPDRVSSMSVKVVNDTTINVTWSRPRRTNGPIDGYSVDVTKQDDLKARQTFLRGPRETFLTFKADSEYTTYEIAVRAFNYDKVDQKTPKAGEREIETIETEGTVPRPPLGVSDGLMDGRKIVEWNAETDAKFNVLCYKIDATAVSSQNRTVLLSRNPFFKLSALTPYTDYVLRISSCIDVSGTKCGESTAFETRTDVGYPSRPNVQLVNRNSTHILFRWSLPSEAHGPISGYEYAYIKKAPGLTPSNWIPISDRSATVDDLDENTEYILHVRAYNINSGGEKLYSPMGELETGTDHGAEGTTNGVVVAASVLMCVVGVSALAFVAYRRFGHAALHVSS